MPKVDQTANCGAWINPTMGDMRRVCVLAAGHYTGPGQNVVPGQHDRADEQSWHTDCPATAGQLNPPREHDHEHPSMPHGSCMVWADHAIGAHPSDVVPDDRTVKESGRTLGTEITGGYRADVKVGDASMSVYGPARFVAYMIHEFATAFEEEAER